LKKFFKSRKGLSPVVASIILIAVTVAVSIAVAAWMGAFNEPKKTENLQIEKITFGGISGDSNNVIAILVTDLSDDVTITEIRINNMTKPFSGTSTLKTYHEQSLLVIYNVGWSSGNKYTIELITGGGNTFDKENTAP